MSLVKVRVRSGAGDSGVIEGLNPKSAAADQIVHLSIEMAAAGETRPQRIEPVLPARDTRLGRAPVLDEKQRTARSQHTSHLGERPGRIWNCAQGPSRDDGINAPAVERHRLC